MFCIIAVGVSCFGNKWSWRVVFCHHCSWRVVFCHHLQLACRVFVINAVGYLFAIIGVLSVLISLLLIILQSTLLVMFIVSVGHVLFSLLLIIRTIDPVVSSVLLTMF